ncbi:MAG TPA: hypothetical protein VMW38_25045 [Terriglobia bacterium]|nr:hypothetical protein [Terriglobia bacterium]
MDRKAEAIKLTDEAKALVLLAGRTWTAYAAICERMIEEKLYEEIGYENFGAWCEAVGDKSAPASYAYARTYSELKKTIAEPAIAQMTMSNAIDLAKVPESKRTADLARMATEMPNNQFRREINKVVPIALEQRSYKGFQLDASAAEVLRKAMKLAEQEGAESEAEQIEAISSSYLASEGQDSHYKATKALVEVIEEQVNADKPSQPPDRKGWASILVISRRAARIFGFAERRVMPAKSADTIAAQRVN